MLSKVAFISDFFYPSVSGGAEIYDSVLIDEIQNRGVKVCKFTSGEFTSPNYLFIKNTDTTETDYISVYADTSSDDPDLLYIPGGGFAILPLTSGITLKAYATTSGTVVEFMVFGTEA